MHLSGPQLPSIYRRATLFLLTVPLPSGDCELLKNRAVDLFVFVSELGALTLWFETGPRVGLLHETIEEMSEQ